MDGERPETSRSGALPAAAPGHRRPTALLVLGPLATVLTLVALLEIAFVGMGIGAPDPGRESVLRYQHVFPPMLEAGHFPDGAEALVTSDRRTPWQAIDRARKPDSLRVVVLGGSAVAGLGFGPNVTFARQLERRLAVLNPGQEVEVVNLGIVALSSREVLAIARDALATCEPDILIVYSGNNEFLELHALEFERLRSSLPARALRGLSRSHIASALRSALGRAPRRRAISNLEMAEADTRFTEAEIIEELEISPEEIAEFASAYGANLASIAAAAEQSNTPLILCTVASNWRWRGREDLSPSWADSLAGGTTPATPAGWQAALEAFESGAGEALAPARHEWLFMRALLHEGAGELAAAREDYRAAMNADPHLRRATDALASQVRHVAARSGAILFDSIELLSGANEDGIIGFETFYDYVHFTPAGCAAMAAGLSSVVQESGESTEHEESDPALAAEAEERWIASLDHDPIAVERWMGLGFGFDRLAERDLWKHSAAVAELDRAVDSDDPARRFLAHAWRGNVGFFLVGGAEDAERDYEAALALKPGEPSVTANLAKLRGRRRP